MFRLTLHVVLAAWATPLFAATLETAVADGHEAALSFATHRAETQGPEQSIRFVNGRCVQSDGQPSSWLNPLPEGTASFLEAARRTKRAQCMGLKASDLSSGYARRSLGGLFGYPTRTDLSSVDLSGSDFGDGPGKSKLRGVNFTGANLQGARFHLADLTDALLVNANLSGANFHHAILMGADLTGARLDGADLEGAWFDKETKLPFPGSPADRRKKGEELGMQYESYERQPHGHDGDERPPRNTGGFGHFGM